MLKIKDNIDLKELEKFGFAKLYRYTGSIHYGLLKHFIGYNFNYYDKDENTKNDILFVKKRDKILKFSVDKEDNELYAIAENIINNLIQAGLVEMVE